MSRAVSGTTGLHLNGDAEPPCVPAAVLSVVVFAGYPLATDVQALSVLSAIANGFALGTMTTYTYDIIP